MTEAVTFKNVSLKFENILILENVNLTIQKGDFIGFVGPNGGGKTTLLKLVLGLLQPSKGSIKVFGKSPKNSFFGYVPQMSMADRSFPITVFELVLLGALYNAPYFGYSKNIKEKASFLLEKVGLYNKRFQAFGSLSGGETQKALIARALMCDPDILVFDEPTANIDPVAEKAIYDFILEYKKEKTILMVTHDLDFILKHVKNVVFVQKKVTATLPENVCEHFALGLYHKPYLKK